MKPAPFEYKLALALSWLVAAILVLLPFHALFTTWAGSNFGHLDLFRTWKEILIILMLPATIWLAWRSPELSKWLTSSWIVRLFVVYVFLHLGLGIWALADARVNDTAFYYALLVNLRFIGFFIFCAVIVSYSDFIKSNWQKIVLVPAAAVITFGLLQLALPHDFLRHFGYGASTIPAYHTVDQDLSNQRIQSTLRGPNPLGAYLVLIIPVALVVLRKNRVKLVATLFLAAIVMFFSYSRSAWIGLLLAALVLFWPKIRTSYRNKRIAAAAMAVVLVLGFGFYLFRTNDAVEDTLFHTSSSSTAKSSNEVRTQSLRGGASDVIDEPLGSGPGTAGPASIRNEPPARIAENYFLQLGQEIGVAGMTIFIAINVLVALQLWRKRADYLAKILLVSLAGITFINLVSHAWTDDTLSLLWWGLAGVAIAPSLAKKRKAQEV